MPKTRPPLSTRRFRLLVFLALALGALAACGGSAESSVEDLFSAEADSTGGSAAGGDESRPAWLNNWMQLPEGVEIETAFNSESTGERLVTGLVRSADAEAVTNEFHGLLASSGFERLGDSIYFVRDGEPAVQLTLRDTGDTVRFNLEYDSNDVQTLRDVYGTDTASDTNATESAAEANAPESGSGVDGTQSFNTTLDLVIDDDRLSQEGHCTFTETSITFTNENSEIVINDPYSESPMIFGIMMQLASDGNEFKSWTVVPSTTPQSVNVIGTGFVAEASFASGIAFGAPPVSGLIAATC